MICGHALSQIAYCEAAHFAFAFLSAFVLLSWMPTMLRHLGIHSDGFISRFSLLVALSSAVALHVLEDFTLKWF